MGIWQESEYRPEYCSKAIEVLATGEGYAAVCVEIGCCRATLYNWRDAHPEFAKALNFGLQHSQREFEKIGMAGIKGEYEKFSPSPWIFTMKNRFRDDYQEDKSENKSVSDSIVEKLIDKLVE